MKNSFHDALQIFFTKYLSNERGISQNTIYNYRDTFVSLLSFLEKNKKMNISKLTLENIATSNITEYLDFLEEKNSISTRNNRLAAIRSFYKYVLNHYPMFSSNAVNMLQIQSKKAQVKAMNYLTNEAITHMFSCINTNDKKSIRISSIIFLLYESGARVSELINIKVFELRLENTPTVILHGKGSKDRLIPINKKLANHLKIYIKLYKLNNDDYLFLNNQKGKLTREGVSHIVKSAFYSAKRKNSSLYPEIFSPHCLRHSKAMHLLENGVNLIYIRDFLGHNSVTTTEIYSKTNPEIKRKHLEKAAANINDVKYSKEEKCELIEWLKTNL